MRKDFVANASHELRSPLTVIAGYLDALADDQKLDPTWSSPVLEMRRQAERMSTHHQRSARTVEAGIRRTRPPRAADRHRRACWRCCARKCSRSSSVRATWSCSSTANAGCWVWRARLHSIVSNLLSNAVKYTPADGEIELRWWTDDDGAHISVRDTGVGIAPEHISAPDRAFLSRRFGPLPRPGRLGTGSRHRQACAAAA